MSGWNTGSGAGGWGGEQAPVYDWAGFDQVETGPQRNEFFPTGVSGVFAIAGLRTITSRTGEPLMIASFRTIRDSKGIAVEGECYDWICKLRNESYLREAKALACAMLPDLSPREIGPEEMKELCSGGAEGIKIFIRSQHKTTRNGSDFTKLTFSAYHGTTIEGMDGSESPT